MKNKKPVLQYSILIASILLLIINVVTFDFQNEKITSLLLRIGGSVLISIAMILTIREINKKSKI
ncbi:hypothetical protein [Flavobacterium geliluteum]|uniref:Uncharacterized protein n=1 Tax=Flavobacterium geliluteum TaxID=2816120 RepID=A0A940X5X1_9FLAO|nr:hypothetical protein [Flavobacterium geliluteum]MBP4138408.1 hypothetical protein [Flavobacterium geliluteum]